jgi:PadR family transcriptional regulator, phenolic acid-responsive transcriptional regulator
MSLKYSILGLLHYKPMHGYRLKEHIERNFGHMWSINYGQIYPNLKKMKAEGLISMHEEACKGEKGPPRKLYTITEAGKQAFQEWLAESPEGSMILRDPFLMRFVFFGFGEEGRALEQIEEQLGVYEKQLARRYSNLNRWEHSGPYVKLMADLGVRMNEVFLDWLKDAHRELLSSDRDNATHAQAAVVEQKSIP